MDGNGRWAQQRGLGRTQGHREGLNAAKRIVKAASDRGIQYLTLYTFSTENWKRPVSEVNFIMDLVKQYLRAELNFYRENRIRLRHAGEPAGLSPDIASELTGAIEDTRHFGGMQVILALNYGGRDEIVRALRRFTQQNGQKGEAVTEAGIASCMDNADVPDPDLIIRTAGEYRTSNFLIWEAAYAEWYFSGKLWPDWDAGDLKLALDDYSGRCRRFGSISAAHTGQGEERQ